MSGPIMAAPLSVDRSALVAEAIRALSSRPAAAGVLLAAGAEVTADQRDQLLAKVAAGEHVELQLELDAYEQQPGAQNRNCIRFRDGIMIALGKTGVGNPFLRDHEQCELDARAGTVLASRTEKRGAGDYIIRQTVSITAPWAVEMALRGLLGSVSIGARPTGPVECSVCGTEVMGDCWHWPGDMVATKDGEECCEWVFTAAELVETSLVNVPAVPSARINAIRAVLSAGAGNRGRMSAPPENDMSKLIAFASVLGLAATVSEDEVLTTVKGVVAERDLLKASVAELAATNAVLAAQAEAHAKAGKLAAEEAFIRGGIESGQIAPGSRVESSMRAFFAVDPDKAKTLLADLPRSTPVGAPPQRARIATETPAAIDASSALAAVNQHATVEGVQAVLAQMGVKGDAAALIAKYTPASVGGKGV